jgi:CrcB protein
MAATLTAGEMQLETWGRILALSVGGVAGVNARYWLGVWINRWASAQFPWATFTINVTGAFAIGFLTALLARWSPHSMLRLLILVGFLGGYTTFSTFAFESVTLWQRGEWVLSFAYMSGSVLAGCAAVVLGAALALGVVQPTWTWMVGMRQSVRTVLAPRYAPDEPDNDRSLLVDRGRRSDVEPGDGEVTAEPRDRAP